MGDPAASNAAAGGGAGERWTNSESDEEWRMELATAWSQSNSERGALRSQYAAVKATFRSELKDDPDLGQFDAAMDKIEKLHEKVQRPLEQLADGEVLLDLSDALVSSAKTENRDGPTPSEFVTALLRKFGARAASLDDSNESFSWSSLGVATSTVFMAAVGNGPMGLEIKERRHAVRRQSEHLGTKPAEPDELAPDQDERNDTDENMAVMFDLLRNNGRVKLEHLILNWQSFAQTVENIFALSFLVKDGRAKIDVVDNGDHFVAPSNAPAAGLIASGEAFNSQFVFRFDMKDWDVTSICTFCIMKRVVEPGAELMPHRSIYRGGEYKTSQSCPDGGCSKVGSDLEHLNEGDSAKEDQLEFTDDEAMETNLANSCSGYDAQKTKKRQCVARRLFDAD
ncbi:hypothetical protein U9M48_038327 [Paspalum notatum var. saurae]|uniref:Non-structural maintenance of chromosomes element 4 n=1 Tax=Paspalum notatum var. saurae TaxID=547442 RepID=A0AAQ3XBY7_PASNO